MPHSKLIRNCAGAVMGVALATTLPDCTGDNQTKFRTNSASSVTIPVGECAIYSGTQLCYRGMDPQKEIFYLNNASVAHPISLDTLKHQVAGSNLTNLFVLEEITPEHLKLRYVGFNKSK